MHYGTTVLYCVVYFHLFYFHFSPYPRKLNDNEKLWIYGTGHRKFRFRGDVDKNTHTERKKPLKTCKIDFRRNYHGFTSSYGAATKFT